MTNQANPPGTVNIDDKRNAVSIHAGIAGQILAASLVLIGIILGYYSIKNLVFFSCAGLLSVTSVLLLLSSFIFGGLGLKALRNNGNNGDWDYSKTHFYFRFQTWLNYLSLLLLAIVLFLPSQKSDELIELEKTNSYLNKVVLYDSCRIETDKHDKMQLDSLQNKIKQLQFEIEKLKVKLDTTKSL